MQIFEDTCLHNISVTVNAYGMEAINYGKKQAVGSIGNGGYEVPSDYYQDIEAMARRKGRNLTEVMDEQYDKLANDLQFEQIEKELGDNEMAIYSHGNDKFSQGVSDWTGMSYQSFKVNMRNGIYQPQFKNVRETLKKRPLSRDVVVRRGNKSFDALAIALGMDVPNPMKADREEIKRLLKQKLSQGGELILKEKAIMSTAFPFAKAKYGAGHPTNNDKDIGIEYIILAKKGTAAANVISGAMKSDEGELLISQNTKFRIIKAEVDGEADIKHGNKKSWKIYMVTVPENEQGIKNDESEDA